MGTLASLVQHLRYGLARWLVPDIHDLLLQRIDDENNAGIGEAHPRMSESEVPSEFAVLRQQPPEDWLARVREGAPQLLVPEDAGGVPSVRLDNLEDRKGPVADNSQPSNPVAPIQARLDMPLDPHRISDRQLDQRKRSPRSNSGTKSEPTLKRNTPMQSGRQEPFLKSDPDAETVPTLVRSAAPLLDDAHLSHRLPRPMSPKMPTRERIANALHAAARAVSGKESRTNRQQKSAVEMEAAEAAASRVPIERGSRPEPLRPREPMKAVDRSTTARHPVARATPDVGGPKQPARYTGTSPQQDLRQLITLPVVTQDKRMVANLAAKRSPDQSDRPSPAPERSVTRVEQHQEAPTHQKRTTERQPYQSLTAPPTHTVKLQKTSGDLGTRTNTSRDVWRNHSYNTISMGRPAVADRISGQRRSRASRWPALMAQSQNRESPIKDLQTQQRQTLLRREQAGVD